MEPQIVERDGKRFVKVRIPVAVDSGGWWVAMADHKKTRDAAISEVVGLAHGLGFDIASHVRLVYALVPVPDEDTFAIVGADEIAET